MACTFQDTINLSTAAVVDLLGYGDDTIAFVSTYFEDAEGLIPFDLSIFTTLKMDVSKKPTDTTPASTGDLNDGLTVAVNELTVSIPGVPAGNYFYDITGVTAAGTVITIQTGRLSTAQNVV